MPEAAEVKLITDQLSSKLTGAKLNQVNVVGGKFLKTGNPFKDLIHQFPFTVNKIRCKGKFIYWEIIQHSKLLNAMINQSGQKIQFFKIGNSLGMTGSWVEQKENVIPQHAALEFITNRGIFYFVDPRRFGNMIVSHHEFGVDPIWRKLDSLGRDFFEQPYSPQEKIDERLTKSKQTLAQLLMRQDILCGVGNYIKSEALYRAGLTPHMVGKHTSVQDWHTLLQAIDNVIKESYAAQGASFLTYKSMDGKGNFSNFFKIYRQEKCPNGHEVTSEQTLDKRTSWWCKICQS